jgi:rhodanese-related sulfurtransferase
MLILLVSLLFACGPSQQAQTSSNPTAPTALEGHSDIDIDELVALREAGDIRLLDVRTVGEYNSGHVPGALHVPGAALDPGAWPLNEYEKGSTVYLICESGGRSTRAAQIVSSAGFKAVNVMGGTGAWRARDLPLEK